ncbi:hypothetical protein, partial [Ruthenibacterium lactatiformans]|uniref:hypothetical protein n=1 Tax=Ruthenibacterium lactatiformans TaxID=1550024 RepID=UPI0019D5C998
QTSFYHVGKITMDFFLGVQLHFTINQTFLLTTVETKKTRLNGFLTLRSAAVSLHCFRILTALPGGLQNLPPAQKV